MEDIGLLMEKLRSSGCWERQGLIDDLLAHPEDGYIPTLEEWLRNGRDAGLRNIAMETYRALGCKAHTSLISLLSDRDADVRVFSASLLGDVNDREAIAGLIGALDDAEVNVRVAAAEALGKIGDEETVCDLASALNGSPWEAMAAIEAIGRIGGDRARQVLEQCIEWEEYLLITCEAIGRAGNRESLRHLEDHALAGNTGGAVVKAMVEIAEREKIRLSSAFLSRMVPILVELQGSPLEDVRRAAFVALSWAEDMRGLPFLIDALDNGELQEYAVCGLIALGEGAADGLADALRKRTGSRGALAKVLSMTGGVRPLLAFVTDEDAEVRTEAVLAIGSLGTMEAKDALQKLANDTSEEVRTAAKQMLEKYGKGDARS
jgi:HEAT repeat protein